MLIYNWYTIHAIILLCENSLAIHYTWREIFYRDNLAFNKRYVIAKYYQLKKRCPL